MCSTLGGHSALLSPTTLTRPCCLWTPPTPAHGGPPGFLSHVPGALMPFPSRTEATPGPSESPGGTGFNGSGGVSGGP